MIGRQFNEKASEIYKRGWNPDGLIAICNRRFINIFGEPLRSPIQNAVHALGVADWMLILDDFREIVVHGVARDLLLAFETEIIDAKS